MIDIPILRPPYIKGKGACFNPVVKNGIPSYADTIKNPKVKNTQAWRQYWEEQLYYIHNGYQTGGLFVPGRFYYYQNFSVMGNIERGNITPDMVDLHLELAYLIDYVKANGKNLICAKGRRKGISEFTHKAVIDYGWRFKYGYKSAVVSGKRGYVDEFLSKWKFGDMNLPPEFKTKHSYGDEIISGYREKDQHGDFVLQGTQNIILAETLHNNPNPLKGFYLNDTVVEEVGETELFIPFYTATIDALKEGTKQVGTMFAYGTGGNINKGSKGFKYAWEHPAEFNAIKFLVPATRFYFYGGATSVQRRLPIETSLYNTHKAYQLIGVEDEIISRKYILDKREAAKKSGNQKKYNEELQNNPITEGEIFRKSNVNNFNLDKLNGQLNAIDASEHKKYSRYILEWVKDEKTGMRKTPLQVTCRPALITDPEENSVYIIDSEHPRKGYKHLYVAGIDSYDQNEAMTKSLGGMCVLIRENSIYGAMKKAPVAIIRTRPPRKEKFWEMALQLTVYYNIEQNVLGDVRCPGILNYWKDLGQEKWIAGRPAKFESPNTEAGNEYWVSLNKYSKPLMIGVMETHIEDYIDNIHFPVLIKEICDYDVETDESDNDLADAYGIALMQDISFELNVKDLSKSDKDDTFELPEFTYGNDGNLYMKSEKVERESAEQDHEGFGVY